MSFITGKHLPRRTFLRGMGATVALPFLDAMVPAGGRRTAPQARRRPRGWSASRRCTASPAATTGAPASTCSRPATTGRDFTLVPDNPLSTLEAYRDYMTIVSNTDVPHGRGVHAARDRRRPLPLERGVPDAGAPEADAGLGHLRRARRSTRCTRSASGRPRRSRRCSSASRTSTRPAAAPTTTRAPTPTRSAGRRRTSRCR